MTERYAADPADLRQAEDAGRLAAVYTAPDPFHWLDRAAEAGVVFGLVAGGGFFTSFLDADIEEASFLDAWLHATPGAAQAVERILRKRRLPEI